MDNYMQFINKLTECLPAFNNIDSIMSVYLGGSVSRGDYIVGSSDIDLYVVCDTEDYNLYFSFEQFVQKIASDFLSEIKRWYPDVVSVAFTQYKDIKKGTSFLGIGADYYSFNDSAKLIYGTDIRDVIIKTDDEQNKKIALEVLTQLKEMVNQDIPEELMTRYFIRGLFGTVFSAVHSALVLNGVYLRGKEQLVNALYTYDEINAKKLQTVYNYWLSFPEFDLTENDKLHLLNLVREIVLSL